MGTELDRLAARPTLAMSYDETRQWAETLASTDLVKKAFQKKPAAIMLVAAMGARMGLEMVQALQSIDVIDNQPIPNAQSKLGQIRVAGHEATFTEHTSERAVLRARRAEYRNDPTKWVEVEWTTEMARDAGMLDEWVDQWVDKVRRDGSKYSYKEVVTLRREGDHYVNAAFGATELPEWALTEIKYGRVKRNDVWWRRRANMLRAACARDMHRMEFSDLLFSDFVAPLEHLVDDSEDAGTGDGDDDVIDAELVEPDAGGETEAETFDRHRKRALAKLGEAGVKGDDARHAAVRAATGGCAESTKRLSAQDVADIVAWCDARPKVSGEAGTEEGGGARENGSGGSQVVEPPAAVPAPTSTESWRALLKECGVTQIDALRRAREIAADKGLAVPDGLADIDDAGLADALAQWARGASA